MSENMSDMGSGDFFRKTRGFIYIFKQPFGTKRESRAQINASNRFHTGIRSNGNRCTHKYVL